MEEQVWIKGRLISDPRLRYTKSERPVCHLHILLDGEEERACEVVVLGAIACVCAEELTPGRAIELVGRRLFPDETQPEDGAHDEIIALEISFLEQETEAHVVATETIDDLQKKRGG
jgi:single-stranded DNA-binding protein